MAHGSTSSLSTAAAEKLIGEHLVCLPTESLPLAQCAGAALRENVYAERDQPPFDRVAMDGIALASAAVTSSGSRRLRLQATQAAGEPPLKLAAETACIEIMTGAVLPTGCDCVVPVEQISVADGVVTLNEDADLRPWRNVHRRASDGRQGDLLIAAGTLLNAPEIAVAASAGMGRLRVSAQPAIMVISTGDELVEPGEPVLPHQIRRSNAYAVAAALQAHGFKRVADDHLPDDADTLRERLDFHLRTHEVLVLSGGVSMGKFDLVPTVLTGLGVHCVLHGIAQRPGRPMWFGMSSDGHAVFALPGNPVSTLVCLARYVLPALFAAMGQSGDYAERIALDEAIEWQPALTGFMPVAVHHDAWGRPWASPRPTNGSGDFGALALTQGFVELPPGPASFAKGYVTRLFRW
jgi:molybdopterin molybdotransferase